MSIRAVVFDVGGVLSVVPPGPRVALPAGVGDATMADVWADGELGRITETDVHTALRDRLGLSAGQVTDVMDEIWRQYLGVANTRLIGYARTLRPDYRTGILSNSFVGAREREQQRYGFGDLVDDLIYSHEAGMSKPDPALWALTCRRMGAEPGEIVFVDDSPELVRQAREFGLRAVRFTETEQAIAEIDGWLGR
ncbi:HAD family hydrolase [Actinoplanes sp. CA-015351]|uniref:HAD family hydrolase n=1 Tax=Actinoplanes sp. CA-015351 TaxID=3239897 RepID=UPI003D9696AF